MVKLLIVYIDDDSVQLVHGNQSSPENPTFSATLQDARCMVIVCIFRAVQRILENKSFVKRRMGKKNLVGRSGKEG